jgi:hypothetical protein
MAGKTRIFFRPLTGLLLVWFLVPFHPVRAQKETPQKPLSDARLEFARKQHDFGDVAQGETVSCRFAFTNTGTAPLLILNVQTTCGCTAPEWPRKPLQPGEKGEILISFNSTKKTGRVNKVITVFSNAQKPEEKLKIVANVIPPGPTPADSIPVLPPGSR